MLDARAQAARRATPPPAASKPSSTSRFAWSPIACTATGKPARAERRTISSNSSPLVISTPEPSRSRAVREPERPVHEDLDVADPEQVVAEPRADADASSSRSSCSCGSDCQTRSVSAPSAWRRLPPGQDSQPAVLVVDGRDAARVRELDRRRAWRRSTRPRASSTTVSRKCQADSSRRTPVGSPRSSVSTTPPGTRRSPFARASAAEFSQSEWPSLAMSATGTSPVTGVERLLRRLDVRLPFAAPPAGSAQPAVGAARPARPAATRATASSSDARAFEPHLPLRERPLGEVDVGVGEAGEDAEAAEVDPLGARECRLVRPDPAGDPRRRRSRARPRVGSAGSIVRMTPFSRITVRETLRAVIPREEIEGRLRALPGRARGGRPRRRADRAGDRPLLPDRDGSERAPRSSPRRASRRSSCARRSSGRARRRRSSASSRCARSGSCPERSRASASRAGGSGSSSTCFRRRRTSGTRGGLPGFELADCSALLRRIRSVKSAWELEQIRLAPRRCSSHVADVDGASRARGHDRARARRRARARASRRRPPGAGPLPRLQQRALLRLGARGAERGRARVDRDADRRPGPERGRLEGRLRAGRSSAASRS